MLVQLESVSRVFFTDDLQTRALWHIDLCVDRGEFLLICGPSGCGKSTLLALMGLMDSPTQGQLSLDGVETTALSHRARAQLRNQYIGFVFQSFHLVGDLNATENVALPLRYAGVPRRQRTARAQEALAAVDMSSRLRHYPSQLSGGQQQRVAIARALAARAPLLLADEPTGNLDSRNSEAILELLADIHAQGQSAVCLVTHNPEHRQYATRALELFDGFVERDGPP